MLQLYCLLQSFIINNTVDCSSEFEGGDILRLFKPLARVKLREFIQFPPFLGGAHSHALAVDSGFFIIFVFFISNGGYEATPLQAVRVPLLVGGSIPHQGGRQMLSFLLTQGVLTHFIPPFVMFGLPYHDTVP